MRRTGSARTGALVSRPVSAVTAPSSAPTCQTRPSVGFLTGIVGPCCLVCCLAHHILMLEIGKKSSQTSDTLSVLYNMNMERGDTFKTDITISPNCAVLIITGNIFCLIFCWESNTVCPVPGPSYSALPDGMSGRCRCKPGYYGDLCQFSAIISHPGPGQCGDNQYLSREKAVGGCINW